MVIMRMDLNGICLPCIMIVVISSNHHHPCFTYPSTDKSQPTSSDFIGKEGGGWVTTAIHVLIEEFAAGGMTKENDSKLRKHLNRKDERPCELYILKDDDNRTYIFLDDFQASFKCVVHHNLSF